MKVFCKSGSGVDRKGRKYASEAFYVRQGSANKYLPQGGLVKPVESAK